MKLNKKSRQGTITILAGLLLTIIGFFFWITQPTTTKLFQLSNDLIGAGIFVVILAILYKVMRR